MRIFTRKCKCSLSGLNRVKLGRKNEKNRFFHDVDNLSVHNILLQVGDSEFSDPVIKRKFDFPLRRILPIPSQYEISDKSRAKR
jgi:hypothetical protein